MAVKILCFDIETRATTGELTEGQKDRALVTLLNAHGLIPR